MISSQKPYSQRRFISAEDAYKTADNDPNAVSSDRLFRVTVKAKDPVMGSVSVSGPDTLSTHKITGYPKGTVLKIGANPYEGYRFVGWNDGNTLAERTIVVSGDMEYIADFENIPAENPPDDPNSGGGGGGGVPTQNNQEVAGHKTDIMQLIRKWWWAIAILALMLFDMKGGK